MPKKFCVIINSNSGSSSKDGAIASIEASFAKHALVADIIRFDPKTDLGGAIQEVVNKHKPNEVVFVATGGDGTINAVAHVCIPQKLTLGLIPLGTFNYFARNFDIPVTIPEAVDVIVAGYSVEASVGKVGEHYFLNSASLGLYKQIIENRESDESVFGRFRIVALISAIITLLSHRKFLNVTLTTNEASVNRKTALVFIVCNPFQLQNLGMALAKCADRNLLAVSILRRVGVIEMVKLLAKGAVKMLDDESNLEQFCTEELEIELNRKSVHVVIDGEIVSCAVPLKIRTCPEALTIIVPAPRDDSHRDST